MFNLGTVHASSSRSILKHVQNRELAHEGSTYAQRTPGRWYIATSDDRCFASKEEKEDLGIWVAILDTRYEAFRAAGMDVEAMYTVRETD